MVKNLFPRYVLRATLNLTGMAVALFWSAGRLDWWAAWAALAISATWLAAVPLVSYRTNPGLIAEYLGAREQAKSWDQAILAALGLLQLIRYIVAGLDQRYDWSGAFPLWAQLVALALCILGYALVIWATAANPNYSQIVRIQTERGHVVATGGPYRVVRHPAYAGFGVYELAVSLLLASWWALIPSLVCVALVLLRTRLEDRTLQADLPGYADYALRVLFRLLPGV